jgi:hypothetical protein
MLRIQTVGWVPSRQLLPWPFVRKGFVKLIKDN